MRRATGLPLVAIGGIGEGNAAETVAAGCDGVAVVSAIVGAHDPRVAAARLAAAVKRGRGRA
jgi:thiamine-phosphate pyrophosphorylase